MRSWVGDIAIGVRLAVGGGRTSLVRFALGAVGIAIAMFVLLVAASVNRMKAEYDVREVADMPDTEVIAGVDPTYYTMTQTQFGGDRVDVNYVHAAGGNHPVPASMRELPGPGEMLASPALAELLSGPDGALLRPRFPDRVVGTLDQLLVPAPGDLVAWVGADASLAHDADVLTVYRFGVPVLWPRLDPGLMALALLGGVAVLLPVFVFVSSVSRIAGAERDRRLSALRLVGSGARQVRRIAAAESLVSAAAGLVLGTGLFLVARLFAEHVALFGLRVYASDVVPDPLLVVVIALAIPALSVLTAQIALRRTVIEPLAVVRQTRPVRRRLWWRVALIVAGVVLLVTQAAADEDSVLWAWAVATGAALLLVGVPVLLPWLVERVAGRIAGGPPSWQLAIRRLQLDSGTSARVVGGVAAVLAGAIAIQAVVTTVQTDERPAAAQRAEPRLEVDTVAGLADDVAADVSSVPAVRATHTVWSLNGFTASTGYYIQVMDCPALRSLAGVEDCADGAVYQFTQPGTPPLLPGTTVEFREYALSTDTYRVTGTWTAPDDIRALGEAPVDGLVHGPVIATPGALPAARDTPASVYVDVDQAGAEQVRNAVAGYRWRARVWATSPVVPPQEQETYRSVRTALYAGAVFTLLLAGVSLLVLALEHLRERRRQLAVLAATGVPRGVLARSLLWQISLPIALGVVIAVATGVPLAWLVLRLNNLPVSIDWPGVGLLCAGATLLALVVTSSTLPFLRGATRLTSLRSE